MRLVTIKEAAKILGVSPQTVVRYLRAGKLKSINIGTGKEKESPRIDLVTFLSNNGIDPRPYFSGHQSGLLSDQIDDAEVLNVPE